MKLREDEIEAVLKFDGARLVVSYMPDDLMARAGAPFTALITTEKINVVRTGSSRNAAVQAAWNAYKRRNNYA